MVEESLRRQQITTLQRLAEIHEVCGQFDQAIEYGRRWLALDPLEEAAHRQLMRLYASGGERLEALRQYDRCRSMLERELGEEPEEETERLHEQIICRKHLPGAESRQLHTRDDSTSLPSKPLLGTPLLLFVQTAVPEEEKMKQLERLFREIVWLERGQVLSATGRMLYAVFFKTDAAMRAALCIRDRVRGYDRGVRIVLSAGERTRQQAPSTMLDERAEMLLQVSPPGQVLLDERAAELAKEVSLPKGLTLRFLGTHRLKDQGPAQPIHVIEYPDLPQEIGQLETLDSRPNNLKRLFFVDLSVLREPKHTVGAITSVLNIRETGGQKQSLLETLKDYLRNKSILLLLDNFEHLLPAVPQITELLADCPPVEDSCHQPWVASYTS